MNAIVPTATALPAHLQHLAQDARLMAMNQAASAGISAGGWPRISIKASRFRLQSPQGEEVVVPENHLDIVVVDANPNGVSKIFYAGAYNPDGEDSAPDCYSDNGVGPSTKAQKPQCGTCAVCPQNVWGSKIANGKQTKACSDVKKVAVIIANNPDGPVFELRVPPASLKNWLLHIEQLNNRGIPAASVVTRMTFDTSADFPKIVFTPVDWATAEQAAAVMEVIGTEEVDQCTGRNDKPIDAAKQLAAPATVAAPAAATVMPPLPPAPPMAMPAAAPVVQPPAAAPVVQAPVQPVQQAAPAAPVTKRKRRTAAEIAADSGHGAAAPVVQPPAAAPVVQAPAGNMFAPQAPAAATTAGPALPAFLLNPGTTPAAPVVNAVNNAAPLAPAGVTNAALDDIIAKAMQA